MTTGQYRCLVAHMLYWQRGLAEAMKDAVVTDCRDAVIEELCKAGYDYDEKADTLSYRL